MTQEEKVRLVIETLDRLYPDVPIPLHHGDPYTLLVAVVLSAHTTDVSVNRVTPRLFACASTPEQMAALPVEQIEEIIRPCGLAPRKARALHELSQVLLGEHGGRVPADLEALEALPGVGHKTASVVLAQAFGQDAFPVDTHIHRLLHRWGLSSGRSVKQTEADARRLFPQQRWRRLHLQIISFGRQHCPARGHDAATCPLCSRIGEGAQDG
ncbi:MAG: endonuclease III [Candidatus Latescibacterota bacterium]